MKLIVVFVVFFMIASVLAYAGEPDIYGSSKTMYELRIAMGLLISQLITMFEVLKVDDISWRLKEQVDAALSTCFKILSLLRLNRYQSVERTEYK